MVLDVYNAWYPECWDEYNIEDLLDGWGDSGAFDNDMYDTLGRKKRSTSAKNRLKRELHSRYVKNDSQ